MISSRVSNERSIFLYYKESGRFLKKKPKEEIHLKHISLSVFTVDSRIRIISWSSPKLKIPHQSHADFCSTDTAGGLDNKKRRYAPRGGVAYRLFLWGFPKGATPPFGTRLCEAKCSVLYALPTLP